MRWRIERGGSTRQPKGEASCKNSKFVPDSRLASSTCGSDTFSILSAVQAYMYMLDISSLSNAPAPFLRTDFLPPPIPDAENGSSSASSHLTSRAAVFCLSAMVADKLG